MLAAFLAMGDRYDTDGEREELGEVEVEAKKSERAKETQLAPCLTLGEIG